MSSNSTDRDEKSKPKSEKHEWQFRDQKIPARLCHLLREGQVTVSDLLLLFVVDSLVKSQGSENGSGCYASNAYLAKAINVHPHYISERIQYLKEKCLLITVHTNHQRYLEAEWSRTAEERASLRGIYGKNNRRAYKKLLERSLKSKGILDECWGTGKPELLYECWGTGKPVPPPTGKPVPNRSDKILKKRGVPLRTAHHPPSNESLLSPGQLANIPDICLRWADKLRRALRSKTPPVPVGRGKRLNWAKEFKALRTNLSKDDERIQALLDWYAKNIDKIFRPTISNARQFCQQFSWLEDVMNKWLKESGEKKPYVTITNGRVTTSKILRS